jgi:hypothetical protein
MTSREYTNDAGDQGPDYQPPPSECDPDDLNEMSCAATGVAAQAAYIASVQTKLDTARTQYKGARKAYSEAREAAEPLVAASKKKLKKLIEQLFCLINDTSVTGKLEQAYDVVAHELEECGDQSGCYCRLDCDDFDEMRHCPPADVAARIADIEQRTKIAEDCFNDLIQEPTKLAERVTARQAEITEIETKIAQSPEPAALKRLYAAALVARGRLMAVWRGFADVNAYIDCLCQTLTCLLRGHTAIADLKRRLAEQQCKKDAHDADCKHKRENTADEVIAAYLKLQSEQPKPGEGYEQRPQPGYGEQPKPGEGYEQRPQPGYGEQPKPSQQGYEGKQYGGQGENPQQRPLR